MGFRLSKSIKIVPGVRLNVSTRGLGYSVGGRGFRVSRSAGGRITRTLSIPGTGISHQSILRQGRTRSARRPAAPPDYFPIPRPASPGLLAPSWEKDLYAVLSSRSAADYIAVARKHGAKAPAARILAATLEGLLHFEHGLGEPGAEARAREILAWVAVQDVSEQMAKFASTYLADRTWPVEIAPGITAYLDLTQDVVRLAAAELHQSAGDLQAAIWTVERATPSAHAALSLAELYSCDDRHSEVIELTNGITNDDDSTALLLALRGRAFGQLGYYDAAREAFTHALRVKSRSAPIRHRTLIERAHVDQQQNRKAAARKSLEKILAEDPSYPGLHDALDALR